ncbi:hypothetical protein ACA910_022258 [Epithemia clementina (nom. ined.)]
MHGKLRSEYKAMQRDPKVAAALSKKADQWYTLISQINEDNALPLTEKLLTVNPDPIYLWNHRRQGTQPLEWETESVLTASALRNNPKAYAAWFHRKWCLVHLVVLNQSTTAATTEPAAILQQELALTIQFLERDERNFHCWNYRRFVVSMLLFLQKSASSASVTAGAALDSPGAWRVLLDDNDEAKESLLLMGAQIISSLKITEDESARHSCDDQTTAAMNNVETTTDWIVHEWDFTQKKIEQNFSNFSAFHYRSKLYDIFLNIKRKEGITTTQHLQNELGLIENAIFTEPDDQTAWWYQSFLLRQEEKASNDNTNRNVEVWNAHVNNLRELAQEMPNSKWVLLGLFNCEMLLLKLKQPLESSTPSSIESHGCDKKKELLGYCERLMEVDPDRKGRYTSLIQRIHQDDKKF